MSDEPETTKKNSDGEGGKSGGAGIEILIGAAATVAAEILIALANGLFGDRSVVVQISNNTPNKLKKIADDHESGGFKEFPPEEIAPNSAIAFTSQSKGPLTGTVGSVTYQGDGFTVLFGWNNPRIGSNSTNDSIDGSNRSRYLIVRRTGEGNTEANMAYFLFIHPIYSVKNSLNSQGDLSKGIRSLRPGVSSMSVRDLVDY